MEPPNVGDQVVFWGRDVGFPLRARAKGMGAIHQRRYPDVCGVGTGHLMQSLVPINIARFGNRIQPNRDGQRAGSFRFNLRQCCGLLIGKELHNG